MVKEQNEGYNGSKVQINRSYTSDTPTNILIQFLEKLFPKIRVVNRKMASKFIVLMQYFKNYGRLCFSCSKKSTGSLPIYLS